MEQRERQELFLVVLGSQMGNVSQACIASGVGRATYYRWLEDEAFEECVGIVREGLLDMAETALLLNVQDGRSQDVQFYLKTQGRSRGYGERLELSGPGGGAIPLASPTYPPEPETLAEWEAHVRTVRKRKTKPKAEPARLIAEVAGPDGNTEAQRGSGVGIAG